MKARRTILSIALFLGCLLGGFASRVAAQEYETFRKKEVSFGFDGFGGLLGERFGVGGGFHVMATSNFFPLGSIEFRPTYLFLFSSGTKGQADYDPATSVILPNILFHINWNPFSRFSFYVGGGPNISVPHDVTDAKIAVGGQGFVGAELFFTEHLRLTIDLGGIGQKIKAGGGSVSNNGIYGTVGLGVVF
ncbi:MAG: hypothetical protein D6812_11510 [Deltaproteobacteria bacterium]|nr:MAG: hypothetical protein D6812_11510 [Deltaproteobacteria bacterium]